MGSRSCKICESDFAASINKMIADGKNEGQIKRAIREVDSEMSWSRPTFYDHKEHITHPLITAAKAAQSALVVVPKTNRGALEMVRDIGLARVADNPALITPDHALKAISLMEMNKRPIENIFILLAKAMNAQSETAEIVGEYIDVTQEEA